MVPGNYDISRFGLLGDHRLPRVSRALERILMAPTSSASRSCPQETQQNLSPFRFSARTVRQEGHLREVSRGSTASTRTRFRAAKNSILANTWRIVHGAISLRNDS